MNFRVLYTNQTFVVSRFEYLLVFLFTILGGFQSSGLIPAKTYLLSIFCVLYLVKNRNTSDKKALWICIASYVIIGFVQSHFYHYTSERAILEIPLLILSGYFIVNYLGYKFRYVLLHVMTCLAIISLVFYFAMLFFHYVPHTPLSTSMYPGNIFFYVIRYNEIDDLRNCGPYWEPGAWGGYIVMTFLFFFDSLKNLWIKYRWHVVILLITLLTTRSTQSYLAGFILIAVYLLKERINLRSLFILGIILFAFFIAYTNLPFLQEKINNQLDLTEDWEDNNSLQSANRFTTSMLDFYYIEKHPFIGNTDKGDIRYSDHDFVMRVMENSGKYGSGSGITSNIAIYGIFPFIFWLFFSYKKLSNQFNKKSALYLLLILLFLGQGEQYSNAIFYLTFPYFHLKKTS